MEHILRNVLMGLLEQPDATLHDVLCIFSDNEFRKRIANSLRNETVGTFLLKEFELFSFGYRADGTAPIQNKAGALILAAPETDLHIRRIMDQGQVLLFNLANGHIGKTARPCLVGYLSQPSDLPPLVGPTHYQPNAETSSCTSTSSRASPPWRWQNMFSEMRNYRVGFTSPISI